MLYILYYNEDDLLVTNINTHAYNITFEYPTNPNTRYVVKEVYDIDQSADFLQKLYNKLSSKLILLRRYDILNMRNLHVDMNVGFKYVNNERDYYDFINIEIYDPVQTSDEFYHDLKILIDEAINDVLYPVPRSLYRQSLKAVNSLYNENRNISTLPRTVQNDVIRYRFDPRLY
jgi:hypothetical protein